MSLTPKQEKFCQCVVSGMSYKDAYLAAYDWKGTDNGAYVEANRLIMNEEVKERIDSLREPIIKVVQQDALNEYERIKALAWERIQQCQNSGDDSAIARYMDILNKMSGTYININKNIDENKSDITHLDTESLKKLSEDV